MTDKFKPLLAPNDEPNLDGISYPFLASLKLDGIRCVFKYGEMLSRSLKPIASKQVRERFEPIRAFSEKYQVIIDGEIYSPELTFQEITKYVMTQDYESKGSIKRNGGVLEIPPHLKFYSFDYIQGSELETPFKKRYQNLLAAHIFEIPSELSVAVDHKEISTKADIEKFFEESLRDGNEGAMLRDPEGIYKRGRGTLKQGIIYKLKPYRTFDAVITGVVQATVVDPSAEKKTNELGRSVTSKKKGDRIPIEKACAFWVDYEGKPLKVVLAMTDEEKEEVWKNQDSYIGRTIEYKGMLVGAKDLPRHPIMLRFREDRD